MDFDRKHGLAFLFSLAAVPMAGCPSDDPAETNGTGSDSSSGSSSSQGTSVTNTTTASTSADSGETTLTTSGTSESGSSDPTITGSTDTGSSSGSDSDSGSDSGSDSESTSDESSGSSDGSTGEPSDLCEGFVDKVVECYPAYAAYQAMFLADCASDISENEMYSMECGMAFEEALACVALADCDELEGETACVAEFAAQDEACGGAVTTGAESGDEPPPPDEG